MVKKFQLEKQGKRCDKSNKLRVVGGVKGSKEGCTFRSNNTGKFCDSHTTLSGRFPLKNGRKRTAVQRYDLRRNKE